MIRINGVRRFGHKISGRIIEIKNSNVEGLELELTGKNAKVTFRNCKGEIVITAKNVATVFFDENCDCFPIVPHNSAEVVGWNVHGCNNVTPYFSHWFRG